MTGKREILIKMNRQIVKPSQRSNPELAAKFLQELLNCGLPISEAMPKILSHFNVIEAEVLKEFNQL